MKFYGKICFSQTIETEPGVWEETEEIRHYAGDVIRRSSQYRQTSNLNDDISITNEISIVADQFANGNFYRIRWIEFCGAKWKVTNIDVQPPRLIIQTGGIFNG